MGNITTMWFLDSKVSPWCTYVDNKNRRIEIRQDRRTGELHLEVSAGDKKIEVDIPKQYSNQFAEFFRRVYPAGGGQLQNVVQFRTKSADIDGNK